MNDFTSVYGTKRCTQKFGQRILRYVSKFGLSEHKNLLLAKKIWKHFKKTNMICMIYVGQNISDVAFFCFNCKVYVWILLWFIAVYYLFIYEFIYELYLFYIYIFIGSCNCLCRSLFCHVVYRFFLVPVGEVRLFPAGGELMDNLVESLKKALDLESAELESQESQESQESPERESEESSEEDLD